MGRKHRWNVRNLSLVLLARRQDGGGATAPAGSFVPDHATSTDSATRDGRADYFRQYHGSLRLPT